MAHASIQIMAIKISHVKIMPNMTGNLETFKLEINKKVRIDVIIKY